MTGGVTYHVFTKLYDSLVSPIIEYGASIWGYKNVSCINAMHNRACRFFLGVGKYTPNAAVTGDMDGYHLFINNGNASYVYGVDLII